jgi:bacteriorhodopsin
MLYESGFISLIIQFIIGIIDVIGLNINIKPDFNIFKDLLKVELSVQIVEFIFYLWMVLNFKNIINITPYRYFDWMITTPAMLLTLMVFLKSEDSTYNNLYDFIKENKQDIIKVAIANLCMLLFGLMGEYNIIKNEIAVLLGFIPFVYYFNLIHKKFINKDTKKDKKNIYWFFVIVWSLYGVAALLPYKNKNIMYNILDLFAKNLFGLILVFYIWKNRQ